MTVNSFDMSVWGLHQAPHAQQQWLHAAFMHDWDGLLLHHHPQQFVDLPMNPAHAFACGVPRKGGLHASRQALQWLLDHGRADLHATDNHGWLPINYAVWFGHAATTDVLLELGSPVQNHQGTQPLDTALEAVAQRKCESSETCARWLLMHGADPNQGRSVDPSFGGVTWMIWALMNERWDWAQCLFQKGLRTLRDKEKMLLALRGSGPALAWAQANGFNMLSVVSPTHEHFEVLCEVDAHVQRELLMAELDAQLLHDHDDEEGKGRRRI